jgi:hypothetical protein
VREGICLDPEGNMKKKIEWGRGKATNNQVEALAL